MDSYPLNGANEFYGSMHDKHNADRKDSYTNGVNGRITSSRNQFFLPFSAHNESTLERNIAKINDVKSHYRKIDLAHTLAVRRSEFSDRYFSVECTEGTSEAKKYECLSTYKKQRSRVLRIAFVFPGKLFLISHGFDKAYISNKGKVHSGQRWALISCGTSLPTRSRSSAWMRFLQESRIHQNGLCKVNALPLLVIEGRANFLSLKTYFEAQVRRE